MSILSLGNLWPVGAGLAYLLLSVLASQGVRRMGHWLASRPNAGALRLRYWPGWPFWGHVASFAFTIAFLFAMLLNGTFAANDVGLQGVAWADLWSWLPGLMVATAVWLLLLWVGYSQKRGMPEEEVRGEWAELGWPCAILHLLQQAASLATLRAALIPMVGAYWGVWLAVLLKMLASHVDPFVRIKLAKPGQRERVYLDWALDWVGATFFVISGSVWASLCGRVICYLAALAAEAVGTRHERRVGRRYASLAEPSAELAEDGRQDDKCGEHGDGEDAKVL
jgi:hypothetical protein